MCFSRSLIGICKYINSIRFLQSLKIFVSIPSYIENTHVLLLSYTCIIGVYIGRLNYEWKVCLFSLSKSILYIPTRILIENILSKVSKFFMQPTTFEFLKFQKSKVQKLKSFKSLYATGSREEEARISWK